MRVIDSHVHFPEDRILDDGTPIVPSGSDKAQVGYSSGRSGKVVHPWIDDEKARWEAAWRFPSPRAVSREEGEKLWCHEVEKYDYLKKVVFVTSGSNDFMADLIARNKDIFIGYAHHDPLLPDAASRLENAIKYQGLKGYKLLGPKIDKPLADPSFNPLWEVAQAARIPVLIHFGIMGGAGGIANHININPMAIHDVAKRFPDMPIIIPHLGCGYVFETLNLGWACPNIYVDTSGSNQWIRWMPYETTLASLFRKYHDTIGAGRILFGTDSSWFPRGFTDAYLDIQVREMYDNGFNHDEVDAVLFRNMAGLLGIA